MTRRDLFNATLGPAQPISDTYLLGNDLSWRGNPYLDPGATQANADDQALAYQAQLSQLSHQAEMQGQSNDAQHKIMLLKQALNNPYGINTSRPPGTYGYSPNTGFQIGGGNLGIYQAPQGAAAYGEWDPRISGQIATGPGSQPLQQINPPLPAFGRPGGQQYPGVPIGVPFQPASQEQLLAEFRQGQAQQFYNPVQNQAEVQNILQNDVNARTRGFSLGYAQQQKNEDDARKQAQQNFNNQLALRRQQESENRTNYGISSAREQAAARSTINPDKNKIAQENVDQRAARYASQDVTQAERDANSRLESGIPLNQILAGYPQLASNPIALQRLSSYAGTLQDQAQQNYDRTHALAQNYNDRIQDAEKQAGLNYWQSIQRDPYNPIRMIPGMEAHDATSEGLMAAQKTLRDPILQEIAKDKSLTGVMKYDPESYSMMELQPNPASKPLIDSSFTPPNLGPSSAFGNYGGAQVLGRFGSPMVRQGPLVGPTQGIVPPLALLPLVSSYDQLTQIPYGGYYRDAYGNRKQNLNHAQVNMFPGSIQQDIGESNPTSWGSGENY